MELPSLKYALLVCLIGMAGISNGQRTVTYLNGLRQPCEAGSAQIVTIKDKTDSGWCVRQYFLPSRQLFSIANYADSSLSIYHGTVKSYHANGKLYQADRYYNGRLDSISVSYYYDGSLLSIRDYGNRKVEAPLIAWYRNGVPSDSLIFHAADSVVVALGWFDNGNISYAGQIKQLKRYGKWKYYHSTGQLSAEEWYNNGVLANKKYYDEEGVPQQDTANGDRPAVFKKGGNSWEDYLQSKVYMPANFAIENASYIISEVTFAINEAGEIENAFVSLPAHPRLDKILLDAIKQSPKWHPAIHKNRRVKDHRTQPFIFKQERRPIQRN
jgi:hypothetical protein